MSTRGNFNLLNKLFLFSFALVCSLTACFAADNSLNGIDVKQVGESDYNILLKVDKSANIQRISNDSDSLTIVLNSTVPSDSVEILYDNAADLDNVIIQKKNNENTVILLQGKNIENAKIFTKELDTGLVKQDDVKENSINNYLFIADKKLAAFSLIGLVLFFALMLSVRPKNRRYSSMPENLKNVKTAKKVTVNTLRNKNINQSRNIPSINYKVNGSARVAMSVPKDFVINKYNAQETEQIRKAG